MDSALLPLLIAITILSLAGLVVLLVLVLRRPEQAIAERVRTEVERVNASVGAALQAGRSDSREAARQTREEIAAAVRELTDSLQQRLGELRTTLDTRLQQMTEADRAAEAQNRAEWQGALKDFREVLAGRLDASTASQGERLHSFAQQLTDLTTRNETRLEALNTLIKASKGHQIDPAVFCAKSGGLNTAENALIGYMLKNKDWCSIPDDAINQLKENHAKSASFAARACSVAAQRRKMEEQQAQGGGAGAPQAQPLPAGPL